MTKADKKPASPLLKLFGYKSFESWHEESCKLQRSFARFIMDVKGKGYESASEDMYAAVKQFDAMLGLYAEALDSSERKVVDELKVKLEMCTCKIIQLAAEYRKSRGRS